MNSPKQALLPDEVPENWRPMLELACREVFEIMLACKLEPLAAASPAPSEFTAMVGLAGKLCGLLSLRCTAQSAVMMASKMLGMDVKAGDEMMWDALGEVSNMIAGNFKNKLTGIGEGCMLSVPTVVTGEDYSLHSMANSTPLEVMFVFEGSPIAVALEVHS